MTKLVAGKSEFHGEKAPSRYFSEYAVPSEMGQQHHVGENTVVLLT